MLWVGNKSLMGENGGGDKIIPDSAYENLLTLDKEKYFSFPRMLAGFYIPDRSLFMHNKVLVGLCGIVVRIPD